MGIVQIIKVKVNTMKNRFLLSACTLLSIALIPTFSFAEDVQKPRPGKEAVFEKLDANKDGKISYDEYKAATNKFLDKRREGFMERMDVDNDSAISFNEYKHWHENFMGQHGKKGGKIGHKPGQGAKEGKAGIGQKDGKHAMGMSNHKRGRAEAEKRWEKMDLNKDGKIEKSEVTQLVTERVNKMFDRRDRNKDGVITKDEVTPPTIEERFAKHDVNGDGKIDKTEMDKFRQERSKQRFEMRDANKDGYLDINEFGRKGPRKNKPNQDLGFGPGDGPEDEI